MTYEKLKRRWKADRLQRQCRAAHLKATIKEKGPAIFRKYAVQQAVLFGSILDERCDDGCDIDLLVTPLSGEQYGACQRDLESAFSTPVDLHTERDDPQFVSKIKERGEVVYAIQS